MRDYDTVLSLIGEALMFGLLALVIGAWAIALGDA